MARFRAFRSRLCTLFVRRRLDDVTDEELRTHLDMLADGLMRAGMGRDEARRQARLRLGGIEQTKEAVRDARATWIDSVLQDLRYALRTFRRAPGFTAVAVLTLGVGIGVNSAVFSIADGVLFRPLPYRDPDRLVAVLGTMSGRTGSFALSASHLFDLKRANRTCADIAAIGTLWNLSIRNGDVSEPVTGIQVSGNFFAVLGVEPAIGRVFTQAELQAGGEQVVVVSHRFWRTRLGGDAGVIGRSVDLPRSRRIVGVMPASFEFPMERTVWGAPDILMPLVTARGAGTQKLIARLKPAVTLSAAQSDLNAIARRFDHSTSPGAEPWPVDGVTLRPLNDLLSGRARPTVTALFLAVTVVLLLACVNVANLLVARGAGRQRELAVRAALGAGRWRLVRQTLTESALLALLAACAGLILSAWVLAAIGARIPDRLQLLKEVGIDGRVLVYTCLASLATSVVFGLMPAIRFSAPDVATALGGASARMTRGRGLHDSLVFAEVALALVVLVAGGLLVNSYWRLARLDPGYQADHVLSIEVFPARNYRTFFPELLDQIRAMPGVRSAGAVNQPLLGRMMTGSNFTVTGREAGGVAVEADNEVHVTAGFFETMRIPLLKGRLLTDRDRIDSLPVAVISESLARMLGPGRNPIGQQLRASPSGGLGRKQEEVREIVGVVGDVRDRAFEMSPVATVYLPFGGQTDAMMQVIIRTDLAPRRIATAVVSRIRSLDGLAKISNVRTGDELVGRSIADRRLNAILFAVFSITALLLCAVGTYGVVAYGVARRTHEIGVRVALGASRVQVLRLIVGQAMMPVVGGLVVGLGGAFGATRVLRSLLFQVTPTDPLTFAAVTVIVLGAALAAAYLPARRATRVDPVAALRCE